MLRSIHTSVNVCVCVCICVKLQHCVYGMYRTHSLLLTQITNKNEKKTHSVMDLLLLPLGSAYNEYSSSMSRFLYIKTIESKIQKFNSNK